MGSISKIMERYDEGTGAPDGASADPAVSLEPTPGDPDSGTATIYAAALTADALGAESAPTPSAEFSAAQAADAMVADDTLVDDTLADDTLVDDTPADETLATDGDTDAPAEASRFEPIPATVRSAAHSDQIAAWDPARVDPAVIAFHNRFSSICEQYRALRARLVSMATGKPQQLLAVTSSVPEEGKSVTTLNLGIILAEGGEQRVLVADGDFRRASLARMIGAEKSPGLADVFLGQASLESVIRATPYPNLKYIAAGSVGDRSCGELLATPRLRDCLGQLRAAFNYTLLDTPPVTTVSDVSALAPHCDGALMVVEMGRTPEPTAQMAVRALQAMNVSVLGCILSRYSDQRKHYYDRYNGYYYYGH